MPESAGVEVRELRLTKPETRLGAAIVFEPGAAGTIVLFDRGALGATVLGMSSYVDERRES